ncbi:hypothetical protein B0H17DRAFT_1092156 [Mycena rosella]|uniref:Uncharacterized protein n=1 Tax=Mycena rosella TaxID=1033263 RepID=A0AAD7CUC8_MYCRO|nr:hypothetical protein B0H17DRAFT_1092156 [Mycena rosella]
MPPRGASKLVAVVVFAVVVLSGFAYTTLRQAPLHPVDYTPMHPDIQALDHPSFAGIRAYERKLPHQRKPGFMSKARPRYVYFPNEAWGTGWNNVFQEQLLNTHLAYLSHRAYVFPDYIPRDHPPFPDTLPDGSRQPLHVPMNALTSGPTGGGSFGAAGDPDSPRAVSFEWWTVVCPDAQVVELKMAETVKELGAAELEAGSERLARWAQKLKGIEAQCVKVTGGSPFDYMFIGSDKIISAWTSYGPSPTLTEYAWSALITRALSRNYALFSPASSTSTSDLPPALAPALSRITHAPGAGTPLHPYPLSAFEPLRADAPPTRGLLALHVRRGDYAEHCNSLADWGADYNAWGLFGRPDLRATGKYPPLPDYLNISDGMPRRDAAYAHCWPVPEVIVARARAERAEYAKEATNAAEGLTTVYIATNGAPEWVAALAGALRADGWGKVASSLDMQLARDEYAVAQAVDMGVLVGAEVFVGVGFSSLSSNVVQLRIAGGHPPGTSRFW